MSTKKQKKKQITTRFRPRSQWEPADWQERHHPTEPVTVRLTASRTAVPCRRRKQDARLWGALSPAQMQAAERIEQSYRVITGCVATARMIYDRLHGRSHARSTENTGEWTNNLLSDYYKWSSDCRRRGINIGAALDVIVHGMPLSIIDKAYCAPLRHGWSRGQFHQALDRYCQMKGWN